MLAYQPVRSLATLNIAIQQGLSGAKRVIPVIDEIPEVKEKENALDLKVNFFGAAWVFTRLPSLFTISKNLDRQGIPWPFWWLQKYLMLKLGGIPVYRVNSKGLIRGAVEEFKTINNYILVIAPEGGVEPVKQFRSGFYYLAKGLNIPYVPIEIDFKNRCFGIQEPKYITGTFEQESEKIASLFSGVEGATRTFKML